MCRGSGRVAGGAGPGRVALVEKMAESVTERFPALPSALYEVRKFVRREAEAAALSPGTINDLILAGPVAEGLDPDEKRLAVGRAAGGTGTRPLLEADGALAPASKPDVAGHR